MSYHRHAFWVAGAVVFAVFVCLGATFLVSCSDGSSISDSVLEENSRDQVISVDDAGWGERVDGMQIRLRADKRAWPVGEAPTFKYDLRNRGPRNLRIWLDERHNPAQEFEVDGAGYYYVTKAIPYAIVLPDPLPFGPGMQYDGRSVSLAGEWRHTGSGSGPLRLELGKHTFRFSVGIQDPENTDSLIPIKSNPVEIEIVPAGEPPGQTGGAEDLEKLIDKLEDSDRKRQIEALVEVLRDEKDIREREAAAVRLDELGWQPGDERQRLRYLLAMRRWDKAAKIGTRAEQVVPGGGVVAGQLQYDVPILLGLKAGVGDRADVLQARWIEFEKMENEVEALVHLSANSAPKGRWEVRVSALDPTGAVLGEATAAMENSGVIRSRMGVEYHVLRFPLGVQERASRFTVKVGEMSVGPPPSPDS